MRRQPCVLPILYYRGGDCDDLSILYCSLLEVLGLDTAFITVPGHIYAAFDTGIQSGPAFDAAGRLCRRKENC
jgi:hypothetical protein